MQTQETDAQIIAAFGNAMKVLQKGKTSTVFSTMTIITAAAHKNHLQLGEARIVMNSMIKKGLVQFDNYAYGLTEAGKVFDFGDHEVPEDQPLAA